MKQISTVLFALTLALPFSLGAVAASNPNPTPASSPAEPTDTFTACLAEYVACAGGCGFNKSCITQCRADFNACMNN